MSRDRRIFLNRTPQAVETEAETKNGKLGSVLQIGGKKVTEDLIIMVVVLIIKSMTPPIPLTAVLLTLAVPGLASAIIAYPSSATVGPDHGIYTETSPGVLTLNPSGNALSELAGNASSPGGNVELFYLSETATYTDMSASGAFANVARTNLDMVFPDGSTCQLSSLNGGDWFYDAGGAYNTSYGAENFANQWFTELVTASGQATTLDGFGLTSQLWDEFVNNGVFAIMSDPNINYAYMDNGSLEFGLGGHIDAGIKIDPILAQMETDNGLPLGTLQNLLPDPFQFSEVVLVDGLPHYSFAATDSGVILDDGVNSYSGNYHITAEKTPEPSSALLLLVSSMAFLASRRSRR